MAFFREEALEAKTERFAGEVVLYRPLSFLWLSMMCLLVTAALGFFVAWGEYTSKEKVSGFLAPDRGAIKIYSPLAGSVIERRVREGQSVRAGETLLVVSAERQSPDMGATLQEGAEQLRRRQTMLAEERDKQRQLVLATDQALQLRIAQLGREYRQLTSEIATQTERVAMADRDFARFNSLVEAKFVSPAQADQKAADRLDQVARLQSLQRTRLALERDIAGAHDEQLAQRLKNTAQLASLDRTGAGVAQDAADFEGRRSVAITAPVDGVVTAIFADVGQISSSVTPLLTLLPAGAALEAQLLVPTRAVGFLVEGEEVNLRYTAFPFERFGHHAGRVKFIAKSTVNPQEIPISIDAKEPMYRVTVTLGKQSVPAYGEERPLAAGMLVDADILIDRRKLYEWALDPLYSVTGRL